MNYFNNSPTVGSNDNHYSTEYLHARILQLEQQLRDAQAQEQRAAMEEAQKPKFGWSRIRKFFNKIVKPIMTFIPNLINAIANYKRAAALVR